MTDLDFFERWEALKCVGDDEYQNMDRNTAVLSVFGVGNRDVHRSRFLTRHIGLTGLCSIRSHPVRFETSVSLSRSTSGPDKKSRGR